MVDVQTAPLRTVQFGIEGKTHCYMYIRLKINLLCLCLGLCSFKNSLILDNHMIIINWVGGLQIEILYKDIWSCREIIFMGKNNIEKNFLVFNWPYCCYFPLYFQCCTRYSILQGRSTD